MVDPLARWIAITGLALSAVKIIYDIWKDHRRAKVLVDQARIHKDLVMSVSIVNTGHRPTTIEGLGVFFTNNEVLGAGYVKDKAGEAERVTFDSDIYSTDLPMPIDQGEPARLYFPIETLAGYYAAGFKIQSIVAWDAEGREYKGKLPRYLRRKLENTKSQA